MQSSVDNPDLSELQSGIGTGPIGIKMCTACCIFTAEFAFN